MVLSKAPSSIPWSSALSSALWARSVRTTRWGIPVARMASVARVVSVTRSVVTGCRPALETVPAVGESSHQIAQKAVELVAFILGQDRGDRLLTPTLFADGRVPCSMPGLRWFDERAAAVRWIGQAAD